MKKWALVTGASKGIGEEIAKELSLLDWNLVLVARSQDLLEKLAVELQANGTENITHPCDLTNKEAINRLKERLEDRNIQLHALVNNAGFGSTGAFSTLDINNELLQIDLNIKALVHLTHVFLPDLEATKGYILNIASTAGFQPGPFMATYYASKSFVLHFSEALAVELQAKGVSVTAHCPGATESEFAAVAGNDKSLLFALRVMDRNLVAKHAVKSMLKRKRVAIVGVMNWFVAKSVAFTPRALVLYLAKKLNQPR